MRYFVLSLLIGGLLPSSSYGIGMGCNTCGPAPCATCEPSCGVPVGDCGVGCGGCGVCGPCDDGPIRWVWRILGFGCADGCGEKYCGDWCSSPPACHDPCDCHGNYLGGHPGPMMYGARAYTAPMESWGQTRPSPTTSQVAGPPRIISGSERVVGPTAAKPLPNVSKVSRTTSPSRPVPIRR